MYKILLSWRYLKTRFIALASIVSVTLGVATLIVVNSVMSGFVDEMKDRLHGILSDVEVASPGLGEIRYPEQHVQEIHRLLGDDLEAVTYAVRIPALLNFEFGGRQWTQQVMLLGIDEATFGQVTDFHPYLLNEHKKNTITFELEHDGYPEKIGSSGWGYRREKALQQKQLEELISQSYNESYAAQASYQESIETQMDAAADVAESAQEPGEQEFTFQPLPDSPPDLSGVESLDEPTSLTPNKIRPFESTCRSPAPFGR